jgi:hypothetical protein
MSPWLLVAVVSSAPATPELERSGLWGWGLGLELPAVGIVTGVAEKSTVGWGYTLGGGLSWEITPTVLSRIFVVGGQTYDGEARVSYIADVAGRQRASSPQAADWVDLEVGVGGAYLWRAAGRRWAPYAGADVTLCYSGYDFTFDDTLAQLRTQELGVEDPCVGPNCGVETNSGVELGLGATVRGGVRLELADWLATLAELSVSYRRVGDEAIDNTLIARDVKTARESVFLVRATFTVRLGL